MYYFAIIINIYKSVVDCIRIYGYNRSRIRRLLVQFIIEWDKLQEEVFIIAIIIYIFIFFFILNK